MSSYHVKSGSISNENGGHSSFRLLSPVPFISTNVTKPLRSWCSVKFGDQKTSKNAIKPTKKLENEGSKQSEKYYFLQRRTDKSKKPLEDKKSPNKIPLAIVAPFKKTLFGSPHIDVPCEDKNIDCSAKPINDNRTKQTKLGHQYTKSSPPCQHSDQHRRDTEQNPNKDGCVNVNKKGDEQGENKKEAITPVTSDNRDVKYKQTAKNDQWMKDSQQYASQKETYSVPVWARGRKSHLHSHIQKARELYDDKSKHQIKEKNNLVTQIRKDDTKETDTSSISNNESCKSKTTAVVFSDDNMTLKSKATSEDRPGCLVEVMENGAHRGASPLKPLRNPPNVVSQQLTEKSQSLPGFHKLPVQSEYINERTRVKNESGSKRSWNTPTSIKDKTADGKTPKSYKNILGNLFYRKKKEFNEETDSFSDKDSENSHENEGGFSKHYSPRERKTLQNSHYDNIITSPLLNNTNVGNQYQNRNVYYPTKHLTRVFSHEELPRNNQCLSNLNKYNLAGTSPYNNKRRMVPSISYDSLPASGISMNSESAYGSINSVQSQSTSKGERSPSMDTLTRRRRREAIMAKVQKIRNTQTNSSSDEDQASHSSLPESESSFKINLTNRKSKSSRTERYLRRKSQECENLRKESEKDRRSKAAVQARILEIQNIKDQQSHINPSQIKNTETQQEKRRWSAKLVYQESNEFDSVIIPNPIPVPNVVNSKWGSSYEGGCNLVDKNLANLKSNSLDLETNKNYSNDISVNAYKESHPLKRKNIEISSIAKRVSPPVPPPRDASRFLSPRGLHRPFSYSFENISHNHYSHKKSLEHFRNHLLSSPNCSNYTDPPLNGPTDMSKRASSEQKLHLPNSPPACKKIDRRSQNVSCFNYIQAPKPLTASVTFIPEINPKLSLLKSVSQTNLSENYRCFIDGNKKTPIANLPPSPSSDYASYISENSSLVTNLSSPRLMSRQEFREKVIDSSLESPKSKNTPVKLPLMNSLPQEKPEPPRRDSSSLNKGNKEILKQTVKSTEFVCDDKKQIEEAFQLEKERIIKNKCSNLEQAFKELEEIHNNLDLNSEDILDGAERRDLPTEHQLMWAKKSSSISYEREPPNSPRFVRQRTPKLRRSCTPDKVTDDVHYRLCMQAKPKPLHKQQNLPSASYMLFSPVHSPTLDSDSPYMQNNIIKMEPNITSDDVTYRNVQRANAIKIIDPQPPFGIPLGPLTQGSSSDYLHLQSKDNYKPVLSSRKYPDAVMDDMAFRNLRKDNSVSDKSLNLSELDNILSETDIMNKPKRNMRSISLDRISNNNSSGRNMHQTVSNVPRHLRNIKRKSTKSNFYEGYKVAIRDSENNKTRNSTPTYKNVHESPQNVDNDLIDSSTETITEQCNAHLSNQNLRSNVIKKSTFPAGAPSLLLGDGEDNPFVDPSRFYPASITLKDSANPNDHLQETELRGTVDIKKLNNLISTIKNSEDSISSETDHNIVSLVHKSNPLKTMVIRPNRNAIQRKGNALSLIETKNNEGNDVVRRHSSIDVASSECSGSYVNGMSYVAVENGRIPGPCKPERIFLTDPLSLKLVIASELEALSLIAQQPAETNKDSLFELKSESCARIPGSSKFSSQSNTKSDKKLDDSEEEIVERSVSDKGNISEFKYESSSPIKLSQHIKPYSNGVQKMGCNLTMHGQHRASFVGNDMKNSPLKTDTNRKGKIYPTRLCQGSPKEEAESLAKRLHSKEPGPSSTFKPVSRVKELEKRNRRLEYEKQRVASLKKVSPEKEKLIKVTEKQENSRNKREASKRHPEFVHSSYKNSENHQRCAPDLESEILKGHKTAENESIILSEKISAKMVQGSNHISMTPVPQPRANANENSHDNGGTDRNSDADRRERIQRYKEERRKQMAARYGPSADLSSSDEEKHAIGSSSVARRRKRGKAGTESSSNEVSTTESKKMFNIKDRQVSKTSEEDIRKSCKNSESLLKSRNLAFNNNKKRDCADDSVYQVKRMVAEPPPVQNIIHDSQDVGSSGISDSMAPRRRSSGSKDKSHKRKSNLNRAPSEEPTPDAGGTTDDSIRRRRRRSDNILTTYSPELTSVQLVASVSSSSSCQSVSALRMSEGSSGGDLKPMKRLSYDGDAKTILSKVKDGKRPNCRQSLKKPEIPQTLRAKEIQLHQRVLHGQERPPVVPETCKNIMTGIKSQRKSQEYGTCFMANKRDQENGTNTLSGHSYSKDQSHLIDRVYDRTSESDQTCEVVNDHFDNLTVKTKNLIARVENMSNVPDDTVCPEDGSLHLTEASKHIKATSLMRSADKSQFKDRINGCDDSKNQKLTEANASKRLAFRDDTGTKEISTVHLSAGISAQSVSFEDDLSDSEYVRPSRRPRLDGMSNVEPKSDHFTQKGSRGSSLESESPRVNSPEPHSILKRKSSRDEQLGSFDRATTPEPQSILKKKSTSRTSSSDNLDCEPRPILKKKNSTDDLDHGEQKPKPILKKKSLTDDEIELAYALPRSILKGSRSREDLPRTDGVLSPASILKRFSKPELDYEGELKPILKRRQTTDGVRRSDNTSDSENENPYRVRSDSAPEAAALLSRSPPGHRATPRHGILKNCRNNRPSAVEDTDFSFLLRSRRPVVEDGPSDSIHFDEPIRPVSPSLSFLSGRKRGVERPISVAERIAGMEALKLPSVEIGAASNNETLPNSMINHEICAADVDSSARTVSILHSNDSSLDDDGAFRMPSRVFQRAAFFQQLEQNGTTEPKSSEDCARKARGARFATQPVTDTEVNEASRRVDSPSGSVAERYGSLDNIQKQPRGSNNGKEKTEAPKSILKADFIRKLSNEDHLKSILKNESPLSSLLTSPEHETRPLKSVLKKDSSVDDNKEIKSILKRQSESLEPGASSDSSSDLTKEPEKSSSHEGKFNKNRKPVMVRDNWAEALRNMGPTRGTETDVIRNSASAGLDTFRNSGALRLEETDGQRNSRSVRLGEPEAGMQALETRTIRSDEILNERTAFEEEALIFGESNPWELDGLPRIRGINTKSIAEATNSQLVSDKKDTSYEMNMSNTVSTYKRNMFTTTSFDKTASSTSDSDSDEEFRFNLQENVVMRNRTNATNYESRYVEVSSSSVISTEDKKESVFKDSVQTENAQKLESTNRNRTEWQTRVLTKDTEGLVQRKARPTSLLERVNQLESSSQQWKNRVEQSDATQFTVAHRMTSSSTSSVPNSVLKGPPRSPSVERLRRTPQPKVFKSKTGGNIPDLLGSVRKELFVRSHSHPNDSHEERTGALVSIPNPDDDAFNAFFSSSSTMKVDQFDVDIGSFDNVTRDSSQLLVNRRNVKVARRQQSSTNPLRVLAMRRDLKAEYTEIKLGVGDRELRRMKVEEISKSSSFAMEALAGLASKENFNAVSLKKVDEKPIVREMPTHIYLMLIQVKGRRHAQVKLVEPRVQSVNAGDDFILITPQELFHYRGEFANVIERAVSSDIVNYIIQTKDMGVSQECRLSEINQNSRTKSNAAFWRHLGGNASSKAANTGLPEDDFYEASIVSSNKVYEVLDNSLIPVEESWGQSPKYELLSSDKVLVFDFGAELYLWAGKFACPEARKNGAALLKELWQEDYDYSDCDINPVSMTLKEESPTMKGKRPAWGICGKITENVETVLFKEKFVDWPDIAQKSRKKEVEKEMMNKPEPVSELVPCDVSEMINNKPESPDLVLEMSHLGRGVEYYDEEERRLLCILTKDVKIWQISENEKTMVEEKSFGHFYDGETYVVRWYYNVTATGRTLKGTPSKHNMTGRTRVAYFFWQGTNSSISDKGVSALMTVELDEERGPHIRVPMGSEQPAFLNLFNGGLVYHCGKSQSHVRDNFRMFLVKGNRENEAHLVEIGLHAKHLRSKSCLIVADVKKDILYLWIGSKSLRHIRKIASHAAFTLSCSSAPEIKWNLVPVSISEQQEGKENIKFLQLFDSLSISSEYFSLLSLPIEIECTPRYWKFEATRGKFEAIEIASTYRCTVVTPFPVTQMELYGSIQPGLFLIDSGDMVWVWQGWWPDGISDNGRAATGSAQLRFSFARRAAFQTALNYVQEKRNLGQEISNLEPQLVIAGMEPLEFCNLFPTWSENPDVRQLQEKLGRYIIGNQYSVRETLRILSKTRYTLEELLRNPRPDGVDQLHLEKYLNDDDFTTAIGMSRTTFHSLPEWKQVDIKKKVNLF